MAKRSVIAHRTAKVIPRIPSKYEIVFFVIAFIFASSLYQAGEHQQNINQFHKDKGSRQTAQTINQQVP